MPVRARKVPARRVAAAAAQVGARDRTTRSARNHIKTTSVSVQFNALYQKRACWHLIAPCRFSTARSEREIKGKRRQHQYWHIRVSRHSMLQLFDISNGMRGHVATFRRAVLT
eukprot:2254323-Rhodomonas_salina.1